MNSNKTPGKDKVDAYVGNLQIQSNQCIIQFALTYGKPEPSKKKAITSLSQAADPTKVRMSVRLAGRMGAPRDSMAMGMKTPGKNLQTDPKQTADWEKKLEEQKSYDFSDDSDDEPIDRED